MDKFVGQGYVGRQKRKNSSQSNAISGLVENRVKNPLVEVALNRL